MKKKTKKREFQCLKLKLQSLKRSKNILQIILCLENYTAGSLRLILIGLQFTIGQIK